MTEYIDKVALIARIKQHAEITTCDDPYTNDIYQMAHRHIIDLIELIPVVRIKGRKPKKGE